MLRRELYEDIFHLLTPYMGDKETRRAIVEQALYGCKVINSVNWEGNSNTFTHNLIVLLDQFGKCGERWTLAYLLDHIAALKGSDISEKATELRISLEKEATVDSSQVELSEQRRVSDLLLLQKLWHFINGRELRQIVHQIDAGAGDFDYYKDRIIAYKNFRYDFEERQFFDRLLINTHDEFEKALTAFDKQLSLYADAEPITDFNGNRRWIWFPHYKEHISEEFYDYKHDKYREAVDLAYVMLDKHREFTNAIRQKFPNFFDE